MSKTKTGVQEQLQLRGEGNTLGIMQVIKVVAIDKRYMYKPESTGILR